LAAVARDDADAQVRAQAVGMLRDLALEAFEGAGEAEGHAAVDALDEAKTLIGIAKNAARESTALRALSRVTDVHALGSIAGHAAGREAAARAEREKRHAAEAARLAAASASAAEAARAAQAAAQAAEQAVRSREDAERRRADDEAAARRREEQQAAERARV